MPPTPSMPICLALGAGIGVVLGAILGVIMGNVGLGIAMGLAGAAFGPVIYLTIKARRQQPSLALPPDIAEPPPLPFPADRLIPTHATLRHVPNDLMMEVHLEPFTLDDETIETRFQFSGIAGLHLPLSPGATHEIEIPKHPQPEDVEGSLYIIDGHHVLDLKRLAFQSIEGQLVVSFEATVLVLVEGLQDPDDNEYDNFQVSMTAPITEIEEAD